MSAFPREQQGCSSSAGAGSCASARVRLSRRKRSRSSLAGANRIRQVPFPEAGLPARRQLGLQQPTPGQRVRPPSLRLFLLLCLLPLKLSSWRLVPLNGEEGTLSSLLPLRKVPVLLAPVGCKVCAAGRWRCKFRVGAQLMAPHGHLSPLNVPLC